MTSRSKHQARGGPLDPALLMSEKQFQQHIVTAARDQGWLVQFHWKSIHSPKGFPDLTLVRGPHLMFAELKTMKGKLTPDQERWLAALREAGQHAFVWKPDQLQSIYEMLIDGPKP